MRSNWSRRGLLGRIGVAGLVGVAGCASAGSSRGATDVYVHNDADVNRTVEVRVTEDGSESPAIDTTFEMPPGTEETINNKVIMGSDYEVGVSYTDDAGGTPYSETQAWDDAGQPLHVILNDQIVFAVQIG
jgi:hypothetical protein